MNQIVFLCLFCGFAGEGQYGSGGDCLGQYVAASRPVAPAPGPNTPQGRGEGVRPRYPRILCFTARWCAPCREMQRDSFDWLRAAEWSVDSSERAHLQIIDVDQSRDLMAQYGVSSVPCLVLIDSSGEVARGTYSGRGIFGELLKKLK